MLALMVLYIHGMKRDFEDYHLRELREAREEVDRAEKDFEASKIAIETAYARLNKAEQNILTGDLA